MPTQEQLLSMQREVLHAVQAHRVVAQTIDTIDINRLADYSVSDFYEEILKGERRIHDAVTQVEAMKEVMKMSEDEQNKAAPPDGESKASEPQVTAPPQQGPPPVQTGGTAPLGAEGEPTATEQADPNAATPQADDLPGEDEA